MTDGLSRVAERVGDPLVQVVQLARALSHLGLMDARARLSVRVGERIISTPRPGDGTPPGRLTVDDLVEVGADGSRASGRWAVPDEVALDLALYRRRPEAGAIVHAQPRFALACAAAGRALLPLTHTESALVHASLSVLGDGGPIATADAAERVAAAMDGADVAILVGIGSIAVGRIPAEAAMLTQQLELLAEANVMALEYTGGREPRLVERVDSHRISAQKAPADDFMGYYAAVAAHRPTGTETPDPEDGSEDGLRRRIVVACRLLHHHGLIEHLEHVSVRIGDGATFLITPRAHLGRLAPEEIATVDMEGRWVAGPLEPPPFRFFHRDLFAARPDVRAIVHTHQPHARALAVAGIALRPLHRAGAAAVAGRQPVYDVPDLMFDAEHRVAATRLLGSAWTIHERSHGVDFLAADVEEATVDALHYEDQARTHLLAGRVGTPTPLAAEVVATISALEPGPLGWWRHFLAELPATQGDADVPNLLEDID